MSYDNTNRGVLFRDNKRTNDRAPEYTGKLDVDGKEYRIVAWVKEGKNGKFFSLQVEEPRQKQGGANTGYSGLDDGGDIPF